jgi:hypothetical protein
MRLAELQAELESRSPTRRRRRSRRRLSSGSKRCRGTRREEPPTRSDLQPGEPRPRRRSERTLPGSLVLEPTCQRDGSAAPPLATGSHRRCLRPCGRASGDAGVPRLGKPAPAVFRLAVADYLGNWYGHDGPGPGKRTNARFRHDAQTFLRSPWAAYLGDAAGLSANAIWHEACRLRLYDQRLGRAA